jgi:MOSC domain-containing protein YiiM
MKILSIQIGQPQTLHSPDPNARAHGKDVVPSDPSWISGIFKSAVEGPRFLGKTNLVGDAQADLKNHGGPDKAICVYAHEHYAHWQEQFGLPELPLGAFGENFTTLGLRETDSCIGDTFTVGEAQAGGEAQQVIVQLSQPRQPCWKLARRWQLGNLVLQVQETGYTGWYFRVLQEGIVQPGDRLRLLERPYPHLTLDEANRVMHHDKEDWEAIAQLMLCPLLSASWRNSLRRRINLHAPADVSARIYGRA